MHFWTEAAKYPKGTIRYQPVGSICMLVTGFENGFAQAVFGKIPLAITLLLSNRLLPNLVIKL